MRAIGMNPTEDELLDKARDIDKNHNGCIDFAGFLQMNAEQMRESAAEKQDESFLKDAFKSFDLNGSGLIPSDKLREAMLTLGEKLTEEEVDEMIQLGDKNKEGEVNYEGTCSH
ncbi:hypothetical protein KUTeg_014404 [Tegillarca granosa]|uniref:EF-hand domain-containing protein n=1 Tax=Tegillarca granosa TaxID=220873 RepID=A0ABQ9EWF8_TEGGR|nr:hypothetical protein KUTeg_014404 [Tegillarca granosa]